MASAAGGDVIVSIPRGGADYDPSGGGDHMVSLPRRTEDAGQPMVQEVVDIVIYFADNVGLHLKVIDGQNATASELFDMVMVERGYHRDACELFSLWLVSDLLELQLKANHVPFKLVCYWEELLEKYCSASDYDRQRDEPIIMFRRNVFCSTAAEVEKFRGGYEDQQFQAMITLLYEESKKNVINSRYPVDQETADKLAGIQAAITSSEKYVGDVSDKNFGTESYFRSKITEYLPRNHCKHKWLSRSAEGRLHTSYLNQPDNYKDDIYTAMNAYLNICRNMPFYGSAFFYGQKPANKGVDEQVIVAINCSGVHIILAKDSTLQSTFEYKDVRWEYVESIQKDVNRLPCLVLQYSENNSTPKYLQIFSRQAVLMDKIIEACVKLQKWLSRHNM